MTQNAQIQPSALYYPVQYIAQAYQDVDEIRNDLFILQLVICVPHYVYDVSLYSEHPA